MTCTRLLLLLLLLLLMLLLLLLEFAIVLIGCNWLPLNRLRGTLLGPPELPPPNWFAIRFNMSVGGDGDDTKLLLLLLLLLALALFALKPFDCGGGGGW